MIPFRLEVPNRDAYPREAIIAGMRAIGYSQANDVKMPGVPLVTWSPWLHTTRDIISRTWPGPIVVVENGWLQPIEGKRYYSVCLWGWNGTGQWVWEEPNGERFYSHVTPIFKKHDIGLHHWGEFRNVHGPLVIPEQRGHTEDVRTVQAKGDTLREMFHDVPNVLIREKDDPVPIDEYLTQAKPRGVCTWTSAVASWALLFGIPVVYGGPSIWCWQLANRWHISQGKLDDRLIPPQHHKMLEVMFRLAWSQWTIEELASGEPFKRLLLPF